MMTVSATELDGVTEIRQPVFHDHRGRFTKTWHAEAFAAASIHGSWPEMFWSSSRRGVIRGLHFQVPPAHHAKLVTCVHGSVWDVCVDLRRTSPTYGRHVARELDADSGTSLHIAPGFAHGFQAMTDGAIMLYCVSTVHDPKSDRGIRWDSCGIPWPMDPQPELMSDRDRAFPPLSGFDSPFDR